MSLKKRLRKRRREYMRSPNNDRLRRYLTLKARLGRFDKRMCLHYGVDPRVNAGCRKAICRAYVAGLVPTATTGGAHAPGSWHYRKNGSNEGCAVDIGHRRDDRYGPQRKAKFHDAEWRRALSGKIRPVELIGPHNSKTILRGSRTSLAEGSALETAHDNHVHEAYN